ncbi:MAG: toll/interleukin-1 receptor domain-containing protein [Tissierellia bacterium]|jgi:hypothetical protein|uniref:toll/interleukin-1 receptor domain-containing protein n=1 Tax=Aminobacterium colombiense TaxID=81468 RepID=UPI003D966E8E|nr:toll/interleukin-1 receptor domain-containing protein [Tissierellia bacterium]
MSTKYDAFLSYASEDEQLANEIAGSLKSHGFKIWYAPIELTVGDEILDSIVKGMNESRSGILLVTKAYLQKNWTNMERSVLTRQHIEKKKGIYQVWHEVEKDEVEKRSSLLSGMLALKTTRGLPEIIKELSKKLAQNAPTVGVIPMYESPKDRFLEGRGEVELGSDDKMASTIWEFVLYSKDSAYPLFIGGDLYSKKDLLFRIANLLPHIPEEAEKWVQKGGKQKLWKMCVDAGFDPNLFA